MLGTTEIKSLQAQRSFMESFDVKRKCLKNAQKHFQDFFAHSNLKDASTSSPFNSTWKKSLKHGIMDYF